MPRIVGISRGNKYSPNHIGNDAAIFKIVVTYLQSLGCEVDIYTEEEFILKPVSAPVIFHMARDKKTLAALKKLEDGGVVVINSSYGIENCVRKAMTEILLENQVPHPYSYVINLAHSYSCENIQQYPCWIKRGDSHAIVKEDVCYVSSWKEAETVLNDFKERNIPTAVINQHLVGDLIKFYGVQGGDYFYWFYPSPCSHSKFGLEKINGEAKGISFTENDLKSYCERASRLLNVPVYGGDCVISPDGEIFIIDFNDWPSFARCREEAGEQIAAYIYKKLTD